jgi:hypothetical protein
MAGSTKVLALWSKDLARAQTLERFAEFNKMASVLKRM